PYHLTMALAAAFYAFLGLLMSFRLACYYVEERWSLLATLAIWWASSLPVYIVFQSLMVARAFRLFGRAIPVVLAQDATQPLCRPVACPRLDGRPHGERLQRQHHGPTCSR